MSNQQSDIPAITNATPLSTRGVKPLPGLSYRVSASYPVVIPAGATISLAAPGNTFYLITATNNLFVRPENGVFSEYAQGTGENCEFFSRLEIENRSANNAVALIFVGWQNFIDNRLILASSSTPNVANPTYPTANASPTVNIPDLSGGSFNDLNGKKWLALNRVCILVFNLDAAANYLLQKASATNGSGVAAANCFPLTPLRFEFSGNYRITNGAGGANINAIVSEVYQAIPG